MDASTFQTIHTNPIIFNIPPSGDSEVVVDPWFVAGFLLLLLGTTLLTVSLILRIK